MAEGEGGGEKGEGRSPHDPPLCPRMRKIYCKLKPLLISSFSTVSISFYHKKLNYDM